MSQHIQQVYNMDRVFPGASFHVEQISSTVSGKLPECPDNQRGLRNGNVSSFDSLMVRIGPWLSPKTRALTVSLALVTFFPSRLCGQNEHRSAFSLRFASLRRFAVTTQKTPTSYVAPTLPNKSSLSLPCSFSV
jgi:hypothetical protein